MIKRTFLSSLLNKRKQKDKIKAKEERDYIKNEIFVIRDESQPSSIVKGPCKNKSCYYNSQYSYYHKDWKFNYRSRHFLTRRKRDRQKQTAKICFFRVLEMVYVRRKTKLLPLVSIKRRRRRRTCPC